MTNQLFRRQDLDGDMSEDQVLIVTAFKLVALAQILEFYPMDKHGNFLGKLKPVSQKSIQPVQVICPISVQYMTVTCNPCSLLQATKTRDIPKVTLIKNSTIFEKFQFLLENVQFASHYIMQTMNECQWPLKRILGIGSI